MAMEFSLPYKSSILFCLFFFNSYVFLCIFITFLHCPTPISAATTNETDRLALLAIKAQITHDPLGIMSSWNDSFHSCNWTGITCGRRHRRVTVINLNSLQLEGSLSPSMGNLTFLTGLNLELNVFHGEVPQDIGRLFRLRDLNLTNNSFTGEIPTNLSRCSNLVYLRLGFNGFVGKIPYWLGTMQKLERVQLHRNNLTGTLPESLGNMSSVKSLSLAMNNLEGSIPEALGRLKTLQFFGIGLNRLSGTIPPSFYNLSSLVTLTLPYNQLNGTLPSDLAFTLPNLQILTIGNNQFTGPLPASLSNATNLIEFDLSGSNFTGKVTIDFRGLPNLWWLVLASNPLGRGETEDLNFMNSLTKCRNLQILDLSDNQFGGALPNSLANLSTQLRSLKLGRNQITGTIPTGIENLVNLTDLQMEKNRLAGSIPDGIGKLQMLRRLDLSENQFSGHIPSSLANLTQLYSLHLEKNQLTGSLPSSFGNFLYLQELDLSQNYLHGTIPAKVMGLSSLTISLNLAQNQFSGPLSSEAGNLINIGYLDVSENKFSGVIPNSLGQCISLESLRMEGNFFEGVIPSSFSSLRGLQVLDLSRNNLSGQIPEYIQRLSLGNLNLSFNHFEGEVPTEGIFKNSSAISVTGNDKLCGGRPELHLPVCTISNSKSKKGEISNGLKLIIPLLSGLLLLVLIMSLLIIKRLRKTKGEPREPSLASHSMKDLILKVSYESLLKATGGFSSANLIGAGGFGSVYKGILGTDETVVAVKVLHMHQRGAVKSFMAECETLRNIRHRNLVRLLTACSSVDFQGNDFKALVYEFMPNGSLENWLHQMDGIHDDLRILSLLQRLNIVIDVAFALDYLHHHCQKPIVHCDLKPSNILLNNDMVAHVGDFGLARFMAEAASNSHSNQSSSVGMKGTIGYAAPEYGMGSKVSTYGDVYSYGILLLEMFTGRRPTDNMFKDGLNLHNFVKMALPERVDEILDPIFVYGGGPEEEENEIRTNENCNMEQVKADQMQECLIAILKTGVSCSVESPRERMGITDVIKELQLIRGILVGTAMDISSSNKVIFQPSQNRF